MKTSTWLAFFSIAAIAALAWLTQQPDTARATLPPAPVTAPGAAAVTDPAPTTPTTHPGFPEADAGRSPSARAGREIWFKATAGNARF
ncbi:MAG: cytochrome c, partial [Thiobacillus sp.]|nr:cytochrome c [Thiobacillus sp.]